MRQKVEASAIRDGSRMPLEAPGNRGRGIPGTPGPWTLQWEEVEQGWCQSQKRPRGTKTPWISRGGGVPGESIRICLSGSMDAVGPGTGATAVVEGAVADRPREVELPPALADWPAANTKKHKDLGRRGRPIMKPIWSSLLYTEPHQDWLSKGIGRRAVEMEARQVPHWNCQMGGTAASQSQ